MQHVNKKTNSDKAGNFKQQVIIRIKFFYKKQRHGKQSINNDADKTDAVNKMKSAMQLY